MGNSVESRQRSQPAKTIQWQESMMRKSLVGLALLAVIGSAAACSDITGYTTGRVTGDYQLRTFNGQTLPAVMGSTAFGNDELIAEVFTIDADGTYADSYQIRTTSTTGVRSTQTFQDFGTWDRNNTAFQFRDSRTGDLFSGSLSGSTLTITQLGDVYVYTR
jgi:hypothetical protein